ncbi:MAG: hypothetical protein ABIW76_16280 [Fibrobacteria bacterium]
MNYSKLTHSLQTLAPMVLIGGASLLFSGCLMNAKENATEKSEYDSDGQSAYMATEVDQMGQVYDQMPSTDAALKTSASGLTITGELVIEPFKYDGGCSCFIRHAVYTGQKGYERDRIDSVTLLDSTGATMDKFNKSKVAKIIHKRNVTKTKDAKQADIRFDITVDIKSDAGVRKGEWNGTMTGSFNGQEFKSGSMTKLIRVWENGRFHFPEAGTIELDRPVFHFLAEFLGDGKAKFTITNKVNHKIHILFVDKNYHESDPVDAP